MKPIKSFFVFATWGIRISVMFFAYIYFLPTIKTLSFTGLDFYISLMFVVFSGLLFIGGFLKNSTLTVFAAIIIFLMSCQQLLFLFDNNTMLEFSSLLSIAFAVLIFLSKGNKK